MLIRVILTVLLLSHISDAQTALPPGIRLFGRFYNDQHEPLQDLPYPLNRGHLDQPDINQDQQSKQPQYIRLIAIDTDRLGNATEPTTFQRQSTHDESRDADRLKIVLWTPFNILHRMNEIFIRAAQDYLVRVMDARRNGNNTTSSPFSGSAPSRSNATSPIQLNQLFIPNPTKEIEIEILHVSREQWFRRPLCARNGEDGFYRQFKESEGSALLPCPSLLLVENGLVPELVSLDYLSRMDRFLPTAPFPVTDIANADRLDYRIGDTWFSYPIASDTRLLAFNATTLRLLGLKLPPPYDNWAPNTWTWQTFLEYLRKMKENNIKYPFQFSASEDEENRLIPIIVQSQGARIINDRDGSAVNESAFLVAVETVVTPLIKEQLMNEDFVPMNDRLASYRKRQLRDPLDEDSKEFCCQNRLPFGPGMAIVSPAQIRFGLRSDGSFADNQTDAEILPAFVPGNTSYLGGYGMSLVRDSLSPSFAFGWIAFLTNPTLPYLNDIAATSFVPPPFTSIRDTTAPWTQPSWAIHKTMLQRGVTMHHPAPPSITQSHVLDTNPFRNMMMEMYFHGSSAKDAVQRAHSVVDVLSLPQCTGEVVKLSTIECDPETSYRTLHFSARNLVRDSCRLSFPQILPFAQDLECPYVDRRSSMGIAGLTLSGLGLVMSLACMLLFMCRKDESGFFVAFLALGGSALAYLSAVAWIDVPSTDICLSRGWLLIIGTSFMIGTMVSLAVWMFFCSRAGIMYRLSKARFYWTLFVILSVNVILLVLWTVVPVQPGLSFIFFTLQDFDRSNQVQIQVPTCESGNMGTLVFLVLVNFVIVSVGWYFSFRNRNLKKNAGQMAPFYSLSVALAIVVCSVPWAVFLPQSVLSTYWRSVYVIFTIFFAVTSVMFVFVLIKLFEDPHVKMIDVANSPMMNPSAFPKKKSPKGGAASPKNGSPRSARFASPLDDEDFVMQRDVRPLTIQTTRPDSEIEPTSNTMYTYPIQQTGSEMNLDQQSIPVPFITVTNMEARSKMDPEVRSSVASSVSWQDHAYAHDSMQSFMTNPAIPAHLQGSEETKRFSTLSAMEKHLLKPPYPKQNEAFAVDKPPRIQSTLSDMLLPDEVDLSEFASPSPPMHQTMPAVPPHLMDEFGMANQSTPASSNDLPMTPRPYSPTTQQRMSSSTSSSSEGLKQSFVYRPLEWHDRQAGVFSPPNIADGNLFGAGSETSVHEWDEQMPSLQWNDQTSPSLEQQHNLTSSGTRVDNGAMNSGTLMAYQDVSAPPPLPSSGPRIENSPPPPVPLTAPLSLIPGNGMLVPPTLNTGTGHQDQVNEKRGARASQYHSMHSSHRSFLSDRTSLSSLQYDSSLLKASLQSPRLVDSERSSVYWEDALRQKAALQK